MKDHISTLVGRYKGKIRSWDVVNEAINDGGNAEDGQTENLRNSRGCRPWGRNSSRSRSSSPTKPTRTPS